MRQDAGSLGVVEFLECLPSAEMLFPFNGGGLHMSKAYLPPLAHFGRTRASSRVLGMLANLQTKFPSSLARSLLGPVVPGAGRLVAFEGTWRCRFSRRAFVLHGAGRSVLGSGSIPGPALLRDTTRLPGPGDGVSRLSNLILARLLLTSEELRANRFTCLDIRLLIDKMGL